MSYGLIEFDDNGKPKCEICGKHYHRVLTHVRQKHYMTEREYKQMFGFDLHKGILSMQSKLKSREAAISNYDSVIHDNLITKGKSNRFQLGDKGRTKDKVSEQTRLSLKSRLTNPDFKMKEAMTANGRELGLSGKGNKARWGKT